MSINVEPALFAEASAIATKPRSTGVAFGLPRLLLRVEGALVLLISTALFATSGSGWLLYAVLFFTPDIFMLGYLRNPRLGAGLYNFGHSYLAPACLYAVSLSDRIHASRLNRLDLDCAYRFRPDGRLRPQIF